MTNVNNAIASESDGVQITNPGYMVGQVWTDKNGNHSWMMLSEDEDFIYGREIHVDRELYRWGKKDGKCYGRVGHFETDYFSDYTHLTNLLGCLYDMPSPLYHNQRIKVGEQYRTVGGEIVTIVSDRYNHNDYIVYSGLISRSHGQISVLYGVSGWEWNGNESLDIRPWFPALNRKHHTSVNT